MPLIEITQDDGVPAGREADIIAAVTQAYAEASGKDPSRVWVIIKRVPGTHWGVGGNTLTNPGGP